MPRKTATRPLRPTPRRSACGGHIARISAKSASRRSRTAGTSARTSPGKAPRVFLPLFRRHSGLPRSEEVVENGYEGSSDRSEHGLSGPRQRRVYTPGRYVCGSCRQSGRESRIAVSRCHRRRGQRRPVGCRVRTRRRDRGPDTERRADQCLRCDACHVGESPCALRRGRTSECRISGRRRASDAV